MGLGRAACGHDPFPARPPHLPGKIKEFAPGPPAEAPDWLALYSGWGGLGSDADAERVRAPATVGSFVLVSWATGSPLFLSLTFAASQFGLAAFAICFFVAHGCI